MASRIASRSVLNGQRSLATQAATKASGSPKVQSSQLANGVTVASLDTGNAVSSLSVLVKTGSRNETYDNLGVNHAIRLAAGLANAKHSSFATCMNIQNCGGKLDVTGSREFTLYTTQAPRNLIGGVSEFLGPLVGSPAFKTWEVYDNVPPQMAYNLANVSGAAIASELLHQAAFRDGLGNSLYAPERMVGKHTPAMLQDYHNKNYTSDRIVVLAMDMDHEIAVKCGEDLGVGKSTGGGSAPTKFMAGEVRQPSGGNMTMLAIGTAAAPASNLKDAVATRLLQYILGIGPKVKWGQGTGLLQKSLSKLSGGVSVSALNYSYSDAGLLGAFVFCETSVAGQALDGTVAALRSINVTEADLAAAKKAMQIDLEDQASSAASCIEYCATNLSLGAKDVVPPNQMVDVFAKTTLADVQAVAKKLANSKFAMGATGNLSTVPYIDQL